MTDKQLQNQAALEVLKQAKAIHGRCYKQAIRNAWFNGNYRAESLDGLAGKLQVIRNTLGPSWLINARV